MYQNSHRLCRSSKKTQRSKTRWPTAIALTWIFCVSPSAQGETRNAPFRSREDGGGVVIAALGAPKVSAEMFEWRYQIRNNSERDAWVCGNLEIHCCEAHLAQDNETLLIQRRLDLRADRLPGAQPSGRYLRLRKGETRTELVSLKLPIQPQYVVSQWREERTT